MSPQDFVRPLQDFARSLSMTSHGLHRAPRGCRLRRTLHDLCRTSRGLHRGLRTVSAELHADVVSDELRTTSAGLRAVSAELRTDVVFDELCPVFAGLSTVYAELRTDVAPAGLRAASTLLGSFEERTLSGEMSQHSDAPEQNQVGTDAAMDVVGTETEGAQVEEAADVSTNVQNDDPLSRFLPPPVTTKCSAALQQKINKFLAYKRAGKSFNAEVRNRKDYRNPDFLQHAVRYQEIDQIGTCFSKDVFDPYGYDKSDYYDEIEADMKRELERKEQEKKRSPKVDFITGGVQPPMSASLSKIPAAVSAAAVAGMPMVSVSAEGVQKEARPNKKSKWDKVDGDIKNHAAPSGHDNLSAAGVSAALLTSANVGAGYAAFAQQKRKEAEEKRTSDYKSDRRS